MILVTGATGTVGDGVVRDLADRGAEVRALVRDPGKASRWAGLDVQPAVGTYEDRDGLRRALAGVQRVFLLSPPGEARAVEQQTAVVDLAAAAGVRHVVKLSSIGADEDTGAAIVEAHRAVERHIEASGMAWTHLRPNWFMQNELGQAEAVAATGAFHAPDVTRVSAVDARDVAAVAARVLTEDGHEGAAYVLTGPQALSYADVAQTLTRVLGRRVRWVEVTLEQARTAMAEGGLDAGLARGFTEIMAGYRRGGASSRVSGAVRELLGREARSFEDFVRDHAGAYRVSARAA